MIKSASFLCCWARLLTIIFIIITLLLLSRLLWKITNEFFVKIRVRIKFTTVKKINSQRWMEEYLRNKEDENDDDGFHWKIHHGGDFLLHYTQD